MQRASVNYFIRQSPGVSLLQGLGCEGLSLRGLGRSLGFWGSGVWS